MEQIDGSRQGPQRPLGETDPPELSQVPGTWDRGMAQMPSGHYQATTGGF